ncbi:MULTISPECIES: HAD family hydrolase [unclassified Streptomyces]|uniref:HAD family hydrolase n=1 Tax=unclassified Streptomyces TaxID=2593676 RepID=UPI000DB9CC00|nr:MULTISPECIES: HAD family hydrolase [unclassified Streptomyces]MYT68191.1 HAD-IA family hydrolase [Streptomyces sp. SID8367]RAJ72762.1 HAD superfamily hydrolase (TIGR01509 family)/HAD superfamily hydrolase (TIGR01549 family) [Streptomyces sp. PsTaAH-137]
MTIRAAVFDVDGTLVDTNYLHTTCWWESLRQAGHFVQMPDVHAAIGLGSADLLEHLLGEGRDRGEDDGISAGHKLLYASWHERLAPFDSAAALLKRLHADGWRVVLATSAGGPELAALRKAIDADDAITATASADDVDAGKPHPEPVLHALDLVGARPEDSVFVGDSVWDMRAGRSAGVTPVAVLSGGISRAELEAAGAAEVYANTAALLDDLESSAFGQR